MLLSNTRSKDLKTQKKQGSILEAVGAISKVTNTLLEVKNSKTLNTTTLNQNGEGLKPIWVPKQNWSIPEIMQQQPQQQINILNKRNIKIDRSTYVS